MIPFSCLCTPDTISYTNLAGRSELVNKDHPSFDKIMGIIREGKYNTLEEREEIDALASVSNGIADLTDGRITIVGGVVMCDGRAVDEAIAEHLIWGLSEGMPMSAYMRFIENLYNNPSNRSLSQLYRFVAHNKMGITDDGHCLMYKRVDENFMDIFSGTFDNSVGKIVEIPRNAVDEDPYQTCSYGLHVCAFHYLKAYGAGDGVSNTNRVVVCKVNPSDFVSIPVDYHNAKARVCRYEVIAEVNDVEDILATRPVWKDDTFETSLDDDFLEDDEDEADEADTNFQVILNDGTILGDGD